MIDIGFNPEQVVMPDPTGKGKKEKKDYNDPRFFKAAIKDPKKGASDTRPDSYQALIRVLPRGRDFSKSFVVDVWRHFFFENNVKCDIVCRKTIDKDEYCPVCDDNWKNFNLARASKNKAAEILYTNRKNKSEHICNVLIVNDLVNPQLNGKVMLWKMPNTIFDMIVEAPNKNKKPKVQGSAFSSATSQVVEPPFFPQDPVNGRDLELSVSRDPKTGNVTYVASTWFEVMNPKPIANTKEEILKLLDECNDLSEFTSNVPSVDKAAKDFAAFHGRLNAKLTQGNPHEHSTEQSAFQTPASGVFNTAPNVKPPEMGNSSDLFKSQAPNPMAAVEAAAPKQAPVAPQPMAMPAADDLPPEDEDDLPF